MQVGRFKAAWEQLVASTPILRTRMINLPVQGLVQVVLCEQVTWSTADSMQQYLAEQAAKPTSLGSPLMRCGILSENQKQTVQFVLTLQHALYDSVLMRLIRQELESLSLGKRTTPLVPFKSFIQHLLSRDKESEIKFWREQFSLFEAPLFPALPSHGYVPKADSVFVFQAPEISWRRDGFTAATVLRAAWAYMISKYSSSAETVFGAIVSGRQTPCDDIDRIAGPTIATVPVRIKVDHAQDNVESFSQAVQIQAVDMIPYEQAGLSSIRRIDDEARRACEFQSVLLVQTPDDISTAESSCFIQDSHETGSAARTEAYSRFNVYALMAICTPEHDELNVDFSYDSQVLDHDVVQRMARHFGQVVEELCNQPLKAPLRQVNMTTDEDLRQVLAWNHASYPAVSRCIHDIFQEAASKNPLATAISAWDGEWSFAELELLTSRFATILHQAGVKRNVIVPICIEKSKWAAAAFLSVIKAGGAALMLDVTLPRTRLDVIVSQTNSTIAVSSKASRDLCALLVNKVVVIDANARSPLDAHMSVILPQVHPSDLLLLIFTSGSTGTSKAVQLSHENFSSAVIHQREVLQMSRDSRVYDFSSHSFDASLWSLIHALCNAATLCIPSESQRLDNLTESIRGFGTTTLFLTPSVARLVDPAKIPTLRRIFLGGEQVTKNDLNAWVPHATAVVVYGPAETSAMATYWQAEGDLPPVIPIGKSIGLRTWIVDSSSDTLAPIGVTGELYLEGPLVSLGYLHDSVKNASSFLEEPVWLPKTPSGSGHVRRVYRTGDLAKYGSDGNLEFVGRKDGQTKLRAQRIELSELEHYVRRRLGDLVKGVAAEVVTPVATGRQTLVIFMQFKEAFQPIDSEWELDLTTAMQHDLPSHLVAGAFIPLPNLPLNASGKLDRIRLRTFGTSLSIEQLSRSQEHYQGPPPSSPVERALQQLWTSVLSVPADSIGTASNFIRLGGDSIAAMQLVSLAHQQRLLLTVANILSKPTLADLALTAETITQCPLASINGYQLFSLLNHPGNREDIQRQVAQLCNVEPEDVEDVYPCTAIQRSLVAVTSRNRGHYIARFQITLQKDIDLSRWRQAWHEISHTIAPILRNRIVQLPLKGLVQAQIRSPLEWRLHDDIDAYLKDDSTRSMDLGEPLTRLALVGDEHSPERHCILTQHHALYDGASISLVLKEVSKAYSGTTDDNAVAIFPAFLEHHKQVDAHAAKEYWSGQFKNCESITFPVLPSRDYAPCADSTVRLELRNICWPKKSFTPSIIVRAAWSIVSAQHIDTDDIVFGAIVTGRQAAIPGIERMIAPLIAALPLRVKIDSNQSVSNFLRQLHKQYIEMIDYEHTDLLQISQLNADVARGNRFNTLLIVQPANQDIYTDFAHGPIRSFRSLHDASGAGLEHHNAQAVMIMAQLRKDGDMQFEINFDSHVVTQTQMARIARQFEHVLRQLCNDGLQKVGDVSAVSDQDLKEIWTWNAVLPQPSEATVVELFAKSVATHPHAQAICSWDGDMSYSELDDITTSLASHLVSLGVGSGDVVPLCFKKSKHHPVAALAAIKAGAACCSIDMTQPEGRMRTIIEQLKPRFSLCSKQCAAICTRLSGTNVVVVDDDEVFKHKLCISAALPSIAPSDVLFVVWTSGSTGTPKGIVTTRENFTSAVVHQEAAFHIKQGTRVFDWVSYSFDVSWSNLLYTLIKGGCLCIPTEHERKSDIAGGFYRRRADYSYFSPSVARVLESPSMPGLRHLSMGGEAIHHEDILRWTHLESISGQYGPAECAQALSIVDLDEHSRSNHIGHSLGARTWLVKPDRPEQLAAVGAIGELLIEGPTVAQGYWKDPAKTEAVFIKSPSWLKRGAPGFLGRHSTVYKTGDLLYYNDDGSLTFVGRKDNLVKLRGQRVELGEVEFHVKSLMPVDVACQSVVTEIIKPQNSDAPILAVFLSLKKSNRGQDKRHAIWRLTKVIEEKFELPQYMIPGAYLVLESVPMTTTDKIDRRALREMGSKYTLEDLAALQSRDNQGASLTSEMEEALRDLWSYVLGIKTSSIKPDSSFLRIGGESIAAMRLVAAARQKHISFTVADVFKHPRLTDLAKIAKYVGGEADQHPVLRHRAFSFLPTKDPKAFLTEFVEPVLDADMDDIADILPATDFQERAISEALEDPPGRWLHWILALPSDVNLLRLKRACAKVVKHYDILRTVFIEAQGQFWQIVLKSPNAAIDIVDAKDEEISAAVNTACEKDLRRARELGASFLRFIVVKHTSESHKLILRMSHAQFDDYSFGTVLDTLSRLYMEEKIPPHTPFGELIVFNERKKEQSLQYWKNRLWDIAYPAWASLDASNGQVYSPADRLSFEQIIPLPSSSSSEDLSLATLFHAACGLVLAQEHAQKEILFGRLVTGRQMLPTNLQAVVGPTLTEIPIIMTVNENDSVLTLAQSLQQQLIEDSKHEAAGMKEIIRHATTWPETCEDFGWRTSFQQEEAGTFTFLGRESEVKVWEREYLPRGRPEVYATPRGAGLVVSFEGNRRFIEEGKARKIVGRICEVLAEIGRGDQL